MKKPKLNSVLLKNKSYGRALKGTKIFFEGKRPSFLKKDGMMKFGKNVLELFKKTFDKYQWIITEGTDEIKTTYGITRIRTSIKSIGRMRQLSIERNKEANEAIIQGIFSKLYPDQFSFNHSLVYKKGTVADIFKEKSILNDLSTEDKEALTKVIPDFIARESVSTVNFLKAEAQIKTLRELAEQIRTEMSNSRLEPWWQDYIHKNILIIQQGYIHSIEKMNVAIGGTKYPDYALITFDGFLDIFEIKRPSTQLLKYDESRENYYWHDEISKAISQVENYIELVSSSADKIRSYIKDKFKIEQKVLRPRGIILAGDARGFESDQKKKDDFRLLSLSTKNILFVTYDELVTRLNNYINVLEKHSLPKDSSPVSNVQRKQKSKKVA